MKISLLIFGVIAAISAFGQEIASFQADIHPVVFRILQSYPPLQKGGYRIEKSGENRYIVLGIGRASLKNGFFQARRGAELDAEAQIAKALNPTQMTVENSREKTSTVSSSGEAESQVIRQKFVKMLVSSHTPFICSCGMWRSGNALYCARAVFVGEFEHGNSQAKLSSRVSDLNCKGESGRLIEAFPYLSSGGTILFRAGETALLLTVALAPGSMMPPNRKFTFARNQAYKNLIAFISGGKLDEQLTVVTKSISSGQGENSSRRTKRKNLESAVKGEFQFIEPQAHWKTTDGQADCFLYVVKLGTVDL